jgi:cell division protein FtsA
MNTIFVLDIGTRFVRGIIFEQTDSNLKVVDVEVLEHKERAMLSGQIHDIKKVAEVVSNIKNNLQQRNNIELKKVCCAVAGRNLFTIEGEFSCQREDFLSSITEDEIKQFEIYAVEDALNKISNETNYYCVGWVVKEYILDGEKLKTLVSHRGKEVSIKVLVTLLPYKVLESLFSVTQECGLEIEYITLEPIAALEATISKDIYKLNLVLVDIGAGTSDIAIISEGKIVGFSMIPYAGDEITEGLCKELLLEFKDAELLKRTLGSRAIDLNQEISYIDIFGRQHKKSIFEILKLIEPYVEKLASLISEGIKSIIKDVELDAVILVGGGSLTPNIEEKVSFYTGLDRMKVGIYGGKIGKEIEGDINIFNPFFACALGIGCLAKKQRGLSVIHIHLNGKLKTLLRLTEKQIDVLSALLSCGFSLREIYGKVGLSRTFYLNKELKVLKGTFPQPCVVRINGEQADLKTIIKEGDSIEFILAKDGEDAKPKVKDLLKDIYKRTIKFNGQIVHLPFKVFINSKEASLEDEIYDGADVIVEYPKTVDEFLLWLNYNLSDLEDKRIKVDINGEIVTSEPKKCYELLINGEHYDIKKILTNKIDINFVEEIFFKKIEPVWYIKEFVISAPKGKDLKVKVNGQEYTFNGQEGKILKNGQEVSLDTQVYDGDEIRLIKGKDAECILVDVFKYINVDRNNLRKIKLFVGGKEANFTTPLYDNAEIEIGFE